MFVFSAEAKVLEGSYFLGVPYEQESYGKRSLNPQPEISNLSHAFSITQAPNIGSASGSVLYNATASQSGNSFDVSLTASVSYQAEGSGIPYFGIDEAASIEISVYSKTTFEERTTFNGDLSLLVNRESSYEHCFTSEFLTGCDEGDGSSINIDAFDHGVVGGIPLSTDSGVHTADLSTWSLLGNETVNYNGIDYVLLGKISVQPRFQFGYTFIIGAQQGDLSANSDVSVNAAVSGSVEHSPPEISSVFQVPAFNGLKPSNSQIGQPNESDGRQLSYEPTTLQPLWLVALVTRRPGYTSNALFRTSFDSQESTAPSSKIHISEGAENVGSCIDAAAASGVVVSGHDVHCALVYPAAEQFGTRKSFKVNLRSLRDGLAGPISHDFMQSSEFRIFFEKFGDDDNNEVPNWFEYWESKDATSHGKPPEVYYRNMPGDFGLHIVPANEYYLFFGEDDRSSVDTFWSRLDYYSCSSSCIYLSDLAALTSLAYLIPPSLQNLFPMPNLPFIGIDNIESQLSHELLHRFVATQAKAIFGPTDSDGDHLPDEMERRINEALGLIHAYIPEANPPIPLPQFNPSGMMGKTTFKSDLANSTEAQQYSDLDLDYWANDEEVLARLVSLGFYILPEIKAFILDQRQGYPHPANDEANPGRNTTPSFSRSDFHQTGTDAEFTGVLTEGVSESGDLRLGFEISTSDPGIYSISGTLLDEEGGLQFANRDINLSTGTQTIFLDFSGEIIANRRVDGKRLLREVSLIGSGFADVFPIAYVTESYSYSDFVATDTIRLSEVGESIYNASDAAISVDVELTMGPDAVAANITMSAYLYSSDGVPYGYAEASQSVSPGSTEIQLRFDARSVLLSREAGPFELRNIELRNGSGLIADYLDRIEIPFDLSNQIFEDRKLVVSSQLEQEPVDRDGDGVIEQIRLTLPLSVHESGNYTIVGNLSSGNGVALGDFSQYRQLSIEDTHIEIFFETEQAVKAKADGPIYLDQLILFDQNGDVIEWLPERPEAANAPWGFWTGDRESPISRILPREPVLRHSSFDVSWSGEDDSSGTGIRSFDIFVAANDGPFELWAEATTDTTLPFAGAFGNTYQFYSIAADNALNLEDVPSNPDLVVHLISPWLNEVDEHDVNNDGQVSPIDALIVINMLSRNAYQNGSIPVTNDGGLARSFTDTTGDGFVTALDALRVINRLSRDSAGKFEGELTDQFPAATQPSYANTIDDAFEIESDWLRSPLVRNSKLLTQLPDGSESFLVEAGDRIEQEREVDSKAEECDRVLSVLSDGNECELLWL